MTEKFIIFTKDGALTAEALKSFCPAAEPEKKGLGGYHTPPIRKKLANSGIKSKFIVLSAPNANAAIKHARSIGISSDKLNYIL